MHLSGLFWMFLTIYQVMWPLYTKFGYFESIRHVLTQFDQHFPDQFVQNILTTCLQCTKLGKLKTHGQYIEEFWYIFYHILTIYWQCVFNFPSSVYCKHVISIFWTNQSGKCWSNWVSTWWMDPKYSNLVYSGHMTWYIIRNI